MQTQDQQEADMEEAQRLLRGTEFAVGRCRHETIHHATLWIFGADGRQVAVVRREEPSGWMQWRAQRMAHGLPICAGFSYSNLADALAYAVGHVK